MARSSLLRNIFKRNKNKDKSVLLKDLLSTSYKNKENTIEALNSVKKAGGGIKDISKRSNLSKSVENFGGKLKFKSIDEAISSLKASNKNKVSNSKEIQKKEKIESIKNKVDEKADEVSKKIGRNLNKNKKVEEKIKQEFEKIVKNEEIINKREQVKDLSEKIAKELGEEVNTKIEVESKRIIEEAKKWEIQNIEAVREYRKDNFETKVKEEYKRLNPKISEEQLGLVVKQAEIVAEVYYSGKGIENQREEILSGIEINGGKLENAYSDLQGIIRLMQKSPKEVKEIKKEWDGIRDALDGLKEPFNLNEFRSFDGLMGVFKNDEVFQNFGFGQNKVLGWADRINKWTRGFLGKNTAKWGGKFISKIGSQSVKSFAENSLKIIAEKGFQQGFNAILKGVLNKGGVTAATAAGSTAAAGAAAAGGPPGWVVAAAIAVLGVIKKLGKKAKDLFEKLGLSLGIKNALQDNLGKIGGGIANFLVKGLMVIVGIPTLIASVGMAISLPFILLFGGIFFGYNMLITNLTSSMVPSVQCNVEDYVFPTGQCSSKNRTVLMRADGMCNGGDTGIKKTLCTSGCGPTATSQILQGTVDKRLTPEFLMHNPESKYYYNHYGSPPDVCGGGTRLRQARSTLEMYLGRGSVGPYLYCRKDDIERMICEGNAVFIYLIRPGGGHYVIATKIDPSTGEIVIRDPGCGCDKLYPSEYEAREWHITGCMAVQVRNYSK